MSDSRQSNTEQVQMASVVKLVPKNHISRKHRKSVDKLNLLMSLSTL